MYEYKNHKASPQLETGRQTYARSRNALEVQLASPVTYNKDTVKTRLKHWK